MKASAFELFISSIIRKNPKKNNKNHSRHTSTKNIMRVGNSQISKHSKSKSIFSSPKKLQTNTKKIHKIFANYERGVYGLLMLNREIQEELFFSIIKKCLKKKTITKENRKEIWINLAKFYLKRNPPDLAILTYQGHKSFIPLDSIMIAKQANNSDGIWDEISNKNNIYLSMSKSNPDENASNKTENEKKKLKNEEKNITNDEKENSVQEKIIQSPKEQNKETEKSENEKIKEEGNETSEKDKKSVELVSELKESKNAAKIKELKEKNSKNLSYKYLINLSNENEEEKIKENNEDTNRRMDRKLTNVNQGNIDVQMIEQIRIDVIRTKQWKNSDYHELLKSLIIKFIIRYESKLEYFQGFNYITSFLLDIFGNQEEALLILDYVKDILLEDFFFDNLCPKLSLLHFQINHVVKHHYPLLYAKWKNNEILSEVLFSSFIISLFTSFVIQEQDFIQEFWDIILVERWEGVIKVLLYMIEVFYDDIIRMDGNDTMKFFSEMKSEPYILKKVKKHSVKDFVNNLKFNSNFLHESKKLFLSIEKKNIQ
jgi:hypothetical protein